MTIGMLQKMRNYNTIINNCINIDIQIENKQIVEFQEAVDDACTDHLGVINLSQSLMLLLLLLSEQSYVVLYMQMQQQYWNQT